MVMSGIPYWTTDIGGFGGGTTTSAGFRELIVRWFQWGAFCPLFRLHGARTGPTWPPGDAGVCGQAASNEVWMFGDEAEAAIVKVMRMREQMRPYVMEQYQAASEFGTPIMRPLFFDFHNDSRCERVDDQQMFGPDYLVAPVLTQVRETRERERGERETCNGRFDEMIHIDLQCGGVCKWFGGALAAVFDIRLRLPNSTPDPARRKGIIHSEI